MFVLKEQIKYNIKNLIVVILCTQLVKRISYPLYIFIVQLVREGKLLEDRFGAPTALDHFKKRLYKFGIGSCPIYYIGRKYLNMIWGYQQEYAGKEIKI